MTPRLDLDAPRRGERRLALAAPGRVVAVGDQDDPLLGGVGEQRGSQPQRRPDVRRGLQWRAAQPVDVAQLLRQPLDERVLAERDDARLVALGHHLERLAQECEGVLAAARADAVGQVDDEDGGQAIDRQHELEAGEGEHERRQQDRPDARARRAAGRPRSAAARRGRG